MQIVPKLLKLAKISKRFKVAVGGRGSGKSVSVAKLVAAKVHQEGIKALAAREHMNSLADSVHSTIMSQIREHHLDGFREQANGITHNRGGSVIYRGLARNPEGLKSMDNIGLCWVEEAQTISETSLEMLTPSIRAPGSEIWMTANPRSCADPFSARFIEPFKTYLDRDGYYEDDLHLIVTCNYMDNPWFPAELEQERAYDYEHKSRALYDHIWLGAYNDTVDDALIQPEWFDACIDAHKRLGFQPLGVEVVAHDPSDTGHDAKGLAYRYGSVLVDAQEMEDGDINEGGDWAAQYAIEHHADVFVWDADGMGVGLKRQFNQMFTGKQIALQMYRGSESPENPTALYEAGESGQAKSNREAFRNRRAQAYWHLRDRCRATFFAVEEGRLTDPSNLISFSSEIKQLQLLRSELCRIPLKPNGMGMIQIMTKQEMLKMGINSPNLADSVAMAFAVRRNAVVNRARTVVRAGGWL